MVEDDKLSGCSVGGGPSGASLDGCNGLVCMGDDVWGIMITIVYMKRRCPSP